MSTENKILNAASQHRQLLATLAELDYAPPALEQSTAYLKQISEQLRSLDGEIKKLAEVTAKERKEHEDLRDSTARRFAYKITGKKEKFQSKAEKEEREYVEALEKEVRARHKHESLLDSRKRAEEQNTELKRAVELRTETQKQLDGLYNSVFDGPSPGFPEEDDLERRLQETQLRYNQAQAALNMDSQAANLLTQAQAAINRCLQSMESALSASQADIFGFGGGFADYFERSALAEAQNFASQAEILAANAKTMQPLVNNLPPINIAHGNVLSDILFDNIFTDLHFHQLIKESEQNIRRYKGMLDQEAVYQRDRAEIVGRESEGLGKELKRSREELMKARKQLFEQVISEGPTAANNAPTAEQSNSASQNPPQSPTHPNDWRSMNPYASMLAEVWEQYPDEAPADNPPQYTPRK